MKGRNIGVEAGAKSVLKHEETELKTLLTHSKKISLLHDKNQLLLKTGSKTWVQREIFKEASL